MNEMKNFFNTASTDTIGECLNGEKLLNASRDAKGNTLLTFESAYEGYSDLLTIMPDGADQQREADGICQYTADGIDRGEKNRRGLNRSQRFGGWCDISL